jgi:iron complex outermembrane receptor protein
MVEASQPPGVIRGKVFDGSTLEPLPGTTILFRRNQGTTTDGNGFYLIKTEPGDINIIFQHIGYESVTKFLSLKPNDTITLNIGLQPQSAEIDQLVISASKVEQKISELTVSMSVVEPKLISKNHITDATELINKVSGVEVIDGQASIRGGSGFSYGAGSRVLTLIDGLPVLSADAGDIKWYSLPLENISQIEVIKGASSVMYGSSALNGVINFRTAEAKSIPETKFYVETGIFDKPQQQNWIWWKTPRTFASTSISHLQRFGNTDIGFGSNFLLDNGYRKLNDEKLGRLSLNVKQHNQKIEGLTYGLNINTSLVDKTDFILWENAENGALKQSSTTAIEMKALFVTVDPFVNFKKSNAFSHDLRMRLQSIQNDFPTASNNNSNSHSLHTEYQLFYNVSKLLNINAGALYFASQIISPFYGNHNGQNFAGYAQLNFSPHSRLKVVAGVRLEQSSLDTNYYKPVSLLRTGINYRSGDYTYFRASFGQGYRYPSIAEKYATTTLGAVRIFPNDFVEPERGWNAEVGLKQGILTPSLNGMVDLAVFYTQNKDMIEYVFGIYPDPMSGSFSYGFRATNIEYSRVYGYELEVSLSRTYGRIEGTIIGGYVFMYPVEYNPVTGMNSDIFLKFRRKHSGKISFNAQYSKFDLGLNLYAKSRILNIDDVFVNPLTRENILPGFYDYWIEKNGGYFIMDFSVGYQINNRFALSLMVKNVTNTEYMGRPGDIMPHRNFSLRLSGRL